MRTVLFFLLGVCVFGQDINKTPSWYNGTKPWTSITVEGRKEILRLHGGFEAARHEAQQPPVSKGDASEARKGEVLVRATIKKLHLDKFYLNPSVFGNTMVLWLPEKAWKSYSAAERKSIEAYAASKYKNWGVGVGRTNGPDVLCDRLVSP